MKRILTAALLLGLVLAPLASMPSDSAVTVNDLDISIPGMNETMQAGKVLWIAGIWHYVNFTLSEDVENVTIKFAKVNPSEEASVNNTYQWHHNTSTSEWKDMLYDHFLKNKKCSRMGRNYSFYLGLIADAENGVWKIIINVDGEKVAQELINVGQAMSGASLSGGDYYFRGEPFTAGTLDSSVYPSSGHALVSNSGNVPMNITIEFENLWERFTVVNAVAGLLPDESRDLEITMVVDSWSARKDSVKASVTLKPLYPVITGTVALTKQFQFNMRMNLQIGHSGFAVADYGDFTFQYEQKKMMNYTDTLDINAYISGDSNVILALDGENLNIVGLKVNDVEVENDFNLALQADKEEHIVVSVKPKRANTIGLMIFEVSGSDIQTRDFTTEVQIGKKPKWYQEEEEGGVSKAIATAFIGITVGLIVVLMLLAIRKQKQLKEGTRKPGPKKPVKKSKKSSTKSKNKGLKGLKRPGGGKK